MPCSASNELIWTADEFVPERFRRGTSGTRSSIPPLQRRAQDLPGAAFAINESVSAGHPRAVSRCAFARHTGLRVPVTLRQASACQCARARTRRAVPRAAGLAQLGDKRGACSVFATQVFSILPPRFVPTASARRRFGPRAARIHARGIANLRHLRPTLHRNRRGGRRWGPDRPGPGRAAVMERMWDSAPHDTQGEVVQRAVQSKRPAILSFRNSATGSARHRGHAWGLHPSATNSPRRHEFELVQRSRGARAQGDRAGTGPVPAAPHLRRGEAVGLGHDPSSKEACLTPTSAAPRRIRNDRLIETLARVRRGGDTNYCLRTRRSSSY